MLYVCQGLASLPPGLSITATPAVRMIAASNALAGAGRAGVENSRTVAATRLLYAGHFRKSLGLQIAASFTALRRRIGPPHYNFAEPQRSSEASY
jgi:hypothetical protein